MPPNPDARHLTRRQREVLQAISASINERGYPPSMREIGQLVGLNSSSSVSHQLNALERQGFIRRDPNTPRAIDLVVVDEVNHQELPPETPPVSAHSQSAAEYNPLQAEAAFIPLVGKIAAGQPITAEESVEDVFPLPAQIVGGGNLFLLEVEGDSMVEAAICDGDWVVVRQQKTANNGEIVAALLDGEATVKTLQRRDGHTWLLPQNPAYPPINGDQASIMGKVTALLRRL